MNQPDEISQKTQRGSAQRAERLFKTRLIFHLVRRRAGRLFISLLILVGVFAGMATLQHWSVQARLQRTTREELGLWANQVANEIAYKGNWDLAGYRRASIAAPSWEVITRDGLVIDIEGFTPGIFGLAQLPNESVFAAPQTIVTPVGEAWRLFGRKLMGGAVIVGYCSPENVAAVDTKLMANAAKFGPTLEKATSTSSREVDFDVDYAVLSAKGEIMAAWGGVPLKTDPHQLPAASDHLAPPYGRGQAVSALP
jgi:hypothetical protein